MVANQNKVPEFNVGIFNGVSGTEQFNWYPGIEAGVAIPLWKKAYNAQQAAAKINVDEKMMVYDYNRKSLEGQQKILLANITKFDRVINEYETTSLNLGNELMSTADKLFSGGEIDYFQYVQSLESAMDIRLSYFDNLYQYNQEVIALKYLLN